MSKFTAFANRSRHCTGKAISMGGADAERLTVTALPAITTYGDRKGTC